MDLLSEDVEVVGGRGCIDDGPVGALDEVLAISDDYIRIGIAHLEESLQSGAGVLGTLAVIAVGEQKRETGLTEPLLFSRREELIDDDLCTVHEVSKLAFPANERVRRLE